MGIGLEKSVSVMVCDRCCYTVFKLAWMKVSYEGCSSELHLCGAGDRTGGCQDQSKVRICPKHKKLCETCMKP